MPFTPEIQRELVIISSVHNYNLNPQTSTYSVEAQVFTGLYEGLFSYNPYTLEPECAIADSFKISRNKLTWTISLKQNAKFSNGDKITAQTVKDSWISLLNPSQNAPFASLFDCVKGAEDYRTGKSKDESQIGLTVKDNYTIIIKLNTPTEHLSKILCHHAFSIINPKENVFSGAFCLSEYNNDHIILTKNQNYWDANNVALPSIRINLSDNSEENTYLFNTGKADWITDYVDITKVYNTSSINYTSLFSTDYIFFKSDKAPFNNPDIRNALLYAIPAEKIRADRLLKATTLVLQLRGYPEIFGVPDEDIEAAQSLLENAGYDGKENKLKITICFTDDEPAKNRAQILQEAWQKIGVETDIIYKTGREYLDAVNTENADLFNYIWIGDFADPLAFLELFRSSSSLNVTGWKNQKYDTLLEEAAKIADTAKRYEKLAEAEQLLLDSGTIYPISRTISVNVVDFDIVSGWFDNALDIHPLKYLKIIKPGPRPNVVKLFEL
ncbi:MAG: peptide ABC transporter substrate-binding protein [Treponema sp.]|nr:peptide ABC transporter substrate-binding protein [Treponema sp.]